MSEQHAVFILKQCCVAISAVFLLWGSLRFLSIPVRQTLFGLFMVFLLVWTFVGPQCFRIWPKATNLEMQLPVFILLGLGSMFAGVCFFRLRKKMPFVGAGMLSLGFLLWGVYLASYPFSQEYKDLSSAGFFVAAVLQLFIAVSMIVLVLEEVRYNAEQVLAEIAAVRSEKEALQVKVLSTEEQCRSLYDQVRLTEGVQKAYEELRRTQQVVVQQERLRALGQMASGVAHDINNALSPIIAYSELLLTTLPDLPDKAREYLQIINQSGEDIAHIVARMREFYRRRSDIRTIDRGEPQSNRRRSHRTDPPPLARRFPTRRHLHPRPERIGTRPAAAVERSQRTPRSIDQFDFQCRGRHAPRRHHQPRHALREPSGFQEDKRRPERQLQIEVRDDGVGMDEKTRQRCLEPFFSTKAQRGGTGLGLAMVYGMMQRHEGTIDIESAPGRGTCIRLTFPVREKTSQPAAVSPAPQAQPEPLAHILCIDDEPQIRQLLSDCLTSFGASGDHGFKRQARDGIVPRG